MYVLLETLGLIALMITFGVYIVNDTIRRFM